MAKLSVGDLIAIEAKYHKDCLSSLHNKYRAKLNSEKSDATLFKELEDKSLIDVIEYVKHTINSCNIVNKAPVFTQQSLIEMYRERLRYHGRSCESIDVEEFAKKVQCTDIRKKIMHPVPGLSSVKTKGRVTLTINDEIGHALFSAF